MKFAKRISLFFIIPMGMYSLGFYSHMKLQEEFYPGKFKMEQTGWEGHSLERQENIVQEQADSIGKEQTVQVIEVSAEDEQIISADTQYVIQEVDLKRDTSVETTWKIPEKYLGMNRKQFIKEMELYQKAPSLKDQELGFVSVEVLSFSKAKVVVRKNYIYKEVSSSFYLVNEKNYVVVYCEDMKTVYMNTNIMLDSLPDDLKREIIRTKYVATEEALYNFLESYSS